MGNKDDNQDNLTVGPKDPAFAQLEAEIANLVAELLYDRLRSRRRSDDQKKPVASDDDNER